MRPQIDPGILQSQLGADVVAVKQNGVLGKKQHFRDFLVGFALLDQVGHADFHRGEIQKFR